MTRTIWLASYPKSGNTWLRMLIANLAAKDEQPVDINDLPERGGIASARGPFDDLTLIDSACSPMTKPMPASARLRGTGARRADDEQDDEDDKPRMPCRCASSRSMTPIR